MMKLRLVAQTGFTMACILCSLWQVSASALTYKSISDANLYKAWYDSSDTTAACTTTESSVNTKGSSSSGVWNSGLQPPYILEQFAIETLKDLAQKEGVDASNAVTQEHVIALVAFMIGEGGDIANSDLFNPLNSGINAPDLLATGNNASGLQSFKSFDAGVEATARTMETPFQNRLAASLTNRNTTAEQFMQTLTYFNQYAGNKFWAEDSVPGGPNHRPANQPEIYYAQRLQFVQQVRGKYADNAGTVLGTPQKEYLLHITAKEKLQFHPTTDTSSQTNQNTPTNNQASCQPGSSGIASSNVVQTARSLAWPNHGGHGNQQSDATPAYQQAMPKYNGSTGYNPYSDCGVFVSTVMVGTGADPTYPKRGTGVQLQYLQTSQKYQEIPNMGNTANLQPGDIFIFSDGPQGHTYIYTGSYTGDDGKSYNAVAASLNQHVPEADYTYFNQDGNAFHIFRLKGGSQ